MKINTTYWTCVYALILLVLARICSGYLSGQSFIGSLFIILFWECVDSGMDYWNSGMAEWKFLKVHFQK